MKTCLFVIALSISSSSLFGQFFQYQPTAFTRTFVATVTNQASAQTYLGIGSSTNNALLNGTNVFTGTIRATAAVTLTNTSNVFAGNGSALTGISAGLGGVATNLSLYPSSDATVPLTITAASAQSANLQEWKTFVGVATAYVAAGGQFRSSDFLVVNPSSPSLGRVQMHYNNNKIYLSAGTILDWTSADNTGGAEDTGLARNAAGVVEINSSTAGQFRDLRARTVTVTNLAFSGGATITKVLTATASLDFNVGAGLVEDLTIALTGAALGNIVTLGVPNASVTASVQYTAWCSAADTVTVRARTSAAEDQTAGTFRVTIIQH